MASPTSRGDEIKFDPNTLSLINAVCAESREKAAWKYVAAQLAVAACGGDTVDVAVPLQMVLSMEGVECRPK